MKERRESREESRKKGVVVRSFDRPVSIVVVVIAASGIVQIALPSSQPFPSASLLMVTPLASLSSPDHPLSITRLTRLVLLITRTSSLLPSGLLLLVLLCLLLVLSQEMRRDLVRRLLEILAIRRGRARSRRTLSVRV